MYPSPIQEVTKSNKEGLRNLLQMAQRTAAHFISTATVKSQSC